MTAQKYRVGWGLVAATAFLLTVIFMYSAPVIAIPACATFGATLTWIIVGRSGK